MPVLLRPPLVDELPDLSALCLISNAYWGFDDGFFSYCSTELNLTARNLKEDPVIIIEDQMGLAGLAHICVMGITCYLDKLIVDPNRMGKGYSKILYHWAMDTARNMGADRLIIEPEPRAASFYERMGAQRAGDSPQESVAGGPLPRYVHPL